MSVVIGRYKDKLYQWDTGQYLQLDGEYDEVHFCQEGSKTLVCKPREKNGHRVVDVPNILLQKSGTITVYEVSRNEEGMETTRARSFWVQARPKPENYVYTQTEVLNFASLENRLANLEGEGLAQAVADYLKDNPITGGGYGLIITDDDNGNVVIESNGSVTITDDGFGNVTIA